MPTRQPARTARRQNSTSSKYMKKRSSNRPTPLNTAAGTRRAEPSTQSAAATGPIFGPIFWPIFWPIFGPSSVRSEAYPLESTTPP